VNHHVVCPAPPLHRSFAIDEAISKKETLKSSSARKLKKDLVDTFPLFEANLEEMFPKKDPFIVYKTKIHIEFLAYKGEVVFFKHEDGPFLPTVRMLQKYPAMLSKVEVDVGAIPYVLNAAPIMSAGIFPKGKIFQELEAGQPVAIFAEGKEHPIAVGLTAMSTADMRAGKRGCGVTNMHTMGDNLWKSYSVEL
jgi:PUA domain protein